ncbi:hypothetical protein Tco_0530951 [Tanacetum coccineum]
MAALQYKDDHNRIAYLGRERGSEDFTDILSYLDHSPLRKYFDTTMHAIAAAGDAGCGSSPKRQPRQKGSPLTPDSPDTDWRPWPSVYLTFSNRDHTNKPATPPTRPIDCCVFEPRPYDFVDPALEELVSFGPPPRPDNYIEPEDIDNLVSMKDDTILGGFHEDSPAGPADAPTPTADAAGRAEDPVLLTRLSQRLTGVWDRSTRYGNRLWNLKENNGGMLFLISCNTSKEGWSERLKQLRQHGWWCDAPATEGDVIFRMS